MTTTQTILTKLNTYTGDDLLNDVIYGLDEYDPDATEAADPNYRNNVFVLADGRTFQRNAGQWTETE